MRLIRFELAGITRVGLISTTDIIAYRDEDMTIEALVSGEQAAVRYFSDVKAGINAKAVLLSEVRVLAPITSAPNNIFCVGLNYQAHVEEGARISGRTENPDVPTFFTKTTSCISDPDGPILLWPAATQQLDYEVELAVIVGKTGRDIDAAQAMDHVFGYCIANDVSARDLQRRHLQWFKGKSLDGSLPLGPCIVTRDEIADPSELVLSLCVNGEERQRASISQMIFAIPTLIESLSAGMTIKAGDVILTGTPSGVGAAMTPPRFLQPGDEVVCTITELGMLRNVVVTA